MRSRKRNAVVLSRTGNRDRVALHIEDLVRFVAMRNFNDKCTKTCIFVSLQFCIGTMSVVGESSHCYNK